jgi:drug/metabolite transporter (DMT)-like permease
MNSPWHSSPALGVAAGLATACLWTGSALCFEASSRRLGSLVVNVLRLLLAVLLFTVLSLIRFGQLLPPALTGDAWLYLGLSGAVGFVVGDIFLFQAFVLIGARLSMLIYASVPLLTAVWGFLFLDERMSGRALFGMGLTVLGIATAVGGKPQAPQGPTRSRDKRTAGILMAFGGAAGQAAGLLLGKRGAIGLDSFAATQIRAFAGLLGFLIVLVVARQVGLTGRLLKTAFSSQAKADQAARHRVRIGLLALSAGACLGPFLGVSLGLLSTQLLPAGMAATLMSLVPVLLIPVSALIFRERVTWMEALGALLAVSGVALLAS